jgi:hypothetical protein
VTEVLPVKKKRKGSTSSLMNTTAKKSMFGCVRALDPTPMDLGETPSGRMCRTKPVKIPEPEMTEDALMNVPVERLFDLISKRYVKIHYKITY